MCGFRGGDCELREAEVHLQSQKSQDDATHQTFENEKTSKLQGGTLASIWLHLLQGFAGILTNTVN